ncbi:MAG: hypothetical protein V4570_10405 [Pseudomonadota bacterium]
MKSKSLIALAAAILLTTGVVQAGDDKASNIIDQNLSKRPYTEPASDSNTSKVDNWDGATLIKQEAGEEKAGPTKYQQLRIRMLGQRPYMEGK